MLALLTFLEVTHTVGDGLQGGLTCGLIALATDFLQTLLLLLANCGIVHLKDIDGILMLQTVLVDTDDGL